MNLFHLFQHLWLFLLLLKRERENEMLLFAVIRLYLHLLAPSFTVCIICFCHNWNIGASVRWVGMVARHRIYRERERWIFCSGFLAKASRKEYSRRPCADNAVHTIFFLCENSANFSSQIFCGERERERKKIFLSQKFSERARGKNFNSQVRISCEANTREIYQFSYQDIN